VEYGSNLSSSAKDTTYQAGIRSVRGLCPSCRKVRGDIQTIDQSTIRKNAQPIRTDAGHTGSYYSNSATLKGCPFKVQFLWRQPFSGLLKSL